MQSFYEDNPCIVLYLCCYGTFNYFEMTSLTVVNISLKSLKSLVKVGSRAAATSKMERFAIIVNGWKSLTIITKRYILDVAAALDPPLLYCTQAI